MSPEAQIMFTNPLGLGSSAQSLLGILCSVRDGLFPLLLTFGVIAFLYAAFLYFTSAGNTEKIGRAKKALFVAALGIILAILSFGLPEIIAQLFNVPASQLPSNC